MSLFSVPVSFGEWLPDLGITHNPGMVKVNNVIPTLNGYRDLRGLESAGDAISSKVLRSHWVREGGAYHVFAADENKLYLQDGTGWNDVSKGATAYTPTPIRWEFVSFGIHVIAVAKFIRPQTYNVSTADDTTKYGDLANSPASAATVGVVRDFVVLGDIEGLGDHYVQWSGYNNIGAWTPSLATQSDYQPLAGDGGPVQKIVSGEVGYIFRQNSIFSMTYIGPPRVFRFDEFGIGRGTTSPNSVVRLDNRIFYYDTAGFYQLDVRNQEFTAIGYNKVDRYVKEQIPAECLKDMQVTIDPNNNLILWSVCPNRNSNTNTMVFVYHYELKKWALWTIDHDLLSLLPTVGSSLDELSTIYPDGIDAQSISVDSQLHAGGDFTLTAFSDEHKFSAFTGGFLEAEFETSEQSTRSNNRVYARKQQAFVEGRSDTNVRCRLIHRDVLTVAPTVTKFYANNKWGFCEAKASARFLSYNLFVSGGFKHCTGLDSYQRNT